MPWIGIARVIRYSGVANLPQGQEDYGEFPAFVERAELPARIVLCFFSESDAQLGREALRGGRT